jgi:hypothetical protein
MSELIVISEASALMHKSLRCELARNLLSHPRYCETCWLDCHKPLAETEALVSLLAVGFQHKEFDLDGFWVRV